MKCYLVIVIICTLLQLCCGGEHDGSDGNKRAAADYNRLRSFDFHSFDSTWNFRQQRKGGEFKRRSAHYYQSSCALHSLSSSDNEISTYEGRKADEKETESYLGEATPVNFYQSSLDLINPTNFYENESNFNSNLSFTTSGPATIINNVGAITASISLGKRLKFSSPLGRVTFKHEIEYLTEQLLNKDDNAYERKYISINFQEEVVDNTMRDDAVYDLLTVGNPSLEMLLGNAKDVAEMGKVALKILKKELPFRWPGVKDAVWDMPTIKAALELHDNYELDATKNESVTEQQRDEENEFIDAVVNTDVMKRTKDFLVQKGYLPNDFYEFKNALRDMWFTRFQRVPNIVGSSAFEYVFLAERLDNKIIGLHNWIYYAKREADGQLNYLGYIGFVFLHDKGAFVKVRSYLNETISNATTFFVGLSPELEMSLYTLCFYISPWYPCPIKLAGFEFTIFTARYHYFGKDILVSANAKFCIPSAPTRPPPPPQSTIHSSNVNNNDQLEDTSTKFNLKISLLKIHYLLMLIIFLITLLRIMIKDCKSIRKYLCKYCGIGIELSLNN